MDNAHQNESPVSTLYVEYYRIQFSCPSKISEG